MRNFKNIVPIVFSFDDNLILPAGVCINSLLINAFESTFYEIFILHDDKAQYPKGNYFDKLKLNFDNFSLKFINIGNPFPNAYEIRGITIPAYYRLLIPEFIPQYDKIMYHDVDVIFRSDMSDIFNNTDMEGFYIAGVISTSFKNKEVRQYRESLGLDAVNYINSGNLILNTKNIIKDNILKSFKDRIKNSYRFQDQDIINIVCKDKIKFLPSYYSGTIDMYGLAINKSKNSPFTEEELEELLVRGNIHYNGPKPWESWCINYDIWWEYYRKSVFFDSKWYFNHFESKYSYLENLQVKQLLRLLYLRIRKTLLNKKSI